MVELPGHPRSFCPRAGGAFPYSNPYRRLSNRENTFLLFRLESVTIYLPFLKLRAEGSSLSWYSDFRKLYQKICQFSNEMRKQYSQIWEGVRASRISEIVLLQIRVVSDWWLCKIFKSLCSIGSVIESETGELADKSPHNVHWILPLNLEQVNLWVVLNSRSLDSVSESGADELADRSPHNVR